MIIRKREGAPQQRNGYKKWYIYTMEYYSEEINSLKENGHIVGVEVSRGSGKNNENIIDLY
jgi:hypothetical protein